ncbi:hypothetical protein BT96DRAFT_911860 [Gymnopus androsaceus JB14]|uniref:Uncharacterized protein n=1 Tax=Gymnopus androsaceus JB14 TaxID=1447944 RepID=A0A6A4IN87_9AGAR|nr:hypothetical protein BT96DRAFT_911860 [Gymnopus androsaceus JB14]
MTTSTTIYIIAGIVSGVVALNLTLLFGWVFLKPKSREPIIEDASTKHSLTSDITVLAHPPLPATSLPTKPAPSAPANYRQLILSPLDSDRRFTPAPQKSIRSVERRKTKPPGLRPTTTNFTERSLQRALSQRSQRSQRSHRSHWSQRSTDSESLYSVASAPRDMHERLFKPMISRLETIIASPSAGSFPDDVQTIVEEHDGLTEDHDTPSPSPPPSTSPHNLHFVLTPPSPITALNVRKNDHIPFNSFSSPSDIPFSTFPDSSFSTPPRVPPRSPLRQH